MRFTIEQYDYAIKQLELAKQQLESEANPCSVCSDSGHLAYECGFNPLVAMYLCQVITKDARTLHDQLHKLESESETKLDTMSNIHQFIHMLAGYEQHMGVQLGPAKIIFPDEEVLRIEREGI